jgi:hypothetical protein
MKELPTSNIAFSFFWGVFGEALLRIWGAKLAWKFLFNK